nr:MAG TPA: hypothetical protein [Caudoviricetes sp.]
MKKEATIFDYARMCKGYGENCQDCPLDLCIDAILDSTDKANEIILNWCKEHPVETRQDRFLNKFPNAKIDVDGVLSICPQCVNKDFSCQTEKRCIGCCKDYWLAEVKENE